MTHDPMEWTVRDPLEETVPDPIERGGRRSARRRALEVAALVVLLPGFLVAHWLDDHHQARGYATNEKVTVVRRGGTGTLSHIQLRLLGRDAGGPAKTSTTPAGAVSLKLVLRARPLDAKAAKGVGALGFRLRDRDGHVWTAYGEPERNPAPAAGTESQVIVTASVPERLVSSVLLEVRPGAFAPSGRVPTPVLRFAH